MSDQKSIKKNEKDKSAKANVDKKPKKTHHSFKKEVGLGDYTAYAGWLPLQERDEAIAELFYSAYFLDDQKVSQRPLTFVFNGGPGAASAFLHMGALGPRRVVFGPNGSIPKPPAKVEDNAETWMHFSDLVFVDPMGTGFSRSIPVKAEKPEESKKKTEERDKSFWKVQRDIESLSEFIQRFLSEYKRWASPIFIVGESYGGFRVARLAKTLQDDYGVALNGAIMVSPAIEFSNLFGHDYDFQAWIDTLPTMAATAFIHGRDGTGSPSLEAHMDKAYDFAIEKLLPALALGSSMSPQARAEVFGEMARLIGVDPKCVEKFQGRIPIHRFARLFFKDQAKVLGLYDTSMVGPDPFPDRAEFEGPDLSLVGTGPLFSSGINQQLREKLKVKTERQYHLLNIDVFLNWSYEEKQEMDQGYAGSMDDLRYGLAMNPHLKVMIVHGRYDLVTPFASSKRLVDQIRDPQRKQVELKTYGGGHMFYSHDDSRLSWFRDMKAYYLAQTS